MSEGLSVSEGLSACREVSPGARSVTDGLWPCRLNRRARPLPSVRELPWPVVCAVCRRDVNGVYLRSPRVRQTFRRNPGGWRTKKEWNSKILRTSTPSTSLSLHPSLSASASPCRPSPRAIANDLSHAPRLRPTSRLTHTVTRTNLSHAHACRPTSRLTGPLHTFGPAERSGAKHPTPSRETNEHRAYGLARMRRPALH